MVVMIKRLIFLCLVVAGLSGPGLAQNPYSVAVRVNESIISYYDIDQRVKLMRALGAAPSNLRHVATEALIDDRLKAELASSFGMALDPGDLERAVARYAEQRNMTAAQLYARLAHSGVSAASLDEFIATSILWRNILNSKFRAQAQPTESELNAQLNTIAVSSSSAIQLGEIILQYADRGQDETTRLATSIVEQLRNGANFSELARQYSRSRSVENGGVIGWLPRARLPDLLKAALRNRGRGGVSDPIFIPSGIIIVKILNIRTVARQIEVPTHITVSYAQLILPLGSNSQRETLRQADRLRRSLDGCRGIDALAANYAQGSGMVDLTPVNNLPADIGLALARLDPRESVALTEPEQVRVLVLCDRVSEMSAESREVLRNQLLTRNIARLSEGLLLELRRTSLITRR